MRLLILITAVFMAGQAIAENQLEVRVNRIEMKGVAADETDDATEEKEAAPATKAQDYNSSRSNTTALMDQGSDLNDDSDDDSIPVDDVCKNGVDQDCDSEIDEAPANHNTTRQR